MHYDILPFRRVRVRICVRACSRTYGCLYVHECCMCIRMWTDLTVALIEVAFDLTTLLNIDGMVHHQ